MLFKDLKAGFYVYIFNKKTFEASQVKVNSDATQPHYDPQTGNTSTKVVDISINFNGTPVIYTFNENTDTGWLPDLTISTVKENIVREVEAIMNNYEEDIKQVEFKKDGVKKCKEILATWDSVYRDKKAQDERLDKLEEGMGQLLKSVSELTKLIKE